MRFFFYALYLVNIKRIACNGKCKISTASLNNEIILQ